jgi:hypothetical protein
VRSSAARARSFERSAMAARRMPGERWAWEMLYFVVSELFPSCESDSCWRTIDVQHAPKLASANESDLDRFAAGFALGEFGRETRHGR